MIFGEKTMGSDKYFSSTDLLHYVDSLIRDTRIREKRSEDKSNYGWLKSTPLQIDWSMDVGLEELRPLVYKMSSESCAAIAVKLDNLTEEEIFTTESLLESFKKLLEEEDNMHMIDRNIKGVKETKNTKKGKINKVHPELMQGRQPTVSFIVENELCWID